MNKEIINGDPGLNGIKELIMWWGWKYMNRREIIDNFSEIHANLTYGDQIEKECAVKIKEITEELKEHWFE